MNNLCNYFLLISQQQEHQMHLWYGQVQLSSCANIHPLVTAEVSTSAGGRVGDRHHVNDLVVSRVSQFNLVPVVVGHHLIPLLGSHLCQDKRRPKVFYQSSKLPLINWRSVHSITTPYGNVTYQVIDEPLDIYNRLFQRQVSKSK